MHVGPVDTSHGRVRVTQVLQTFDGEGSREPVSAHDESTQLVPIQQTDRQTECFQSHVVLQFQLLQLYFTIHPALPTPPPPAAAPTTTPVTTPTRTASAAIHLHLHEPLSPLCTISLLAVVHLLKKVRNNSIFPTCDSNSF